MVKTPASEIDPDRTAEIAAVMEETGFDEARATFIVALERGETYGDVVSVGPMTREERRRIGLDIVAFDDDDPDLEAESDAKLGGDAVRW